MAKVSRTADGKAIAIWLPFMAGSQCSSLDFGCAQQLIDRVVAGRHFNSLRCRSSGEKRGYRIRFPPVLPVRINAGGDGELHWSAAARIGRIHVGTARNQLAHNVVVGSPRRDVQRGGVASKLEVGIAVRPGRVDGDPEVEQNANAVKIRRAGKAGEQTSTKVYQLLSQIRISRD